jgi:hypothetical protein
MATIILDPAAAGCIHPVHWLPVRTKEPTAALAKDDLQHGFTVQPLDTSTGAGDAPGSAVEQRMDACERYEVLAVPRLDLAVDPACTSEQKVVETTLRGRRLLGACVCAFALVNSNVLLVDAKR